MLTRPVEICTVILTHIPLKTRFEMKRICIQLATTFLILWAGFTGAQNQQQRIDSLVMLMRTAGREWNNYATPLIKIGEAAVPGLIKNAEDKTLNQWNRRISVMTLNQIDSKQWVNPALKILFDENEDPVLRNHTTAGLRGEDLTFVKTELWQLYNQTEEESYKSNLAGLLLTADTALAYQAFCELYQSEISHLKRNALYNLVRIRPKESTAWYLNALQCGDWMTANLAMDSLIHSDDLSPDDFFSIYNRPGVSEEVQWRIVYTLGHSKNPDFIPFFVEALQNEKWLVNNEAALSLCHFNAKHVMTALKSLKSDRRPFTKKNVKWVKQHLKH
jgi:HEAT repeat protein